MLREYGMNARWWFKKEDLYLSRMVLSLPSMKYCNKVCNAIWSIAWHCIPSYNTLLVNVAIKIRSETEDDGAQIFYGERRELYLCF